MVKEYSIQISTPSELVLDFLKEMAKEVNNNGVLMSSIENEIIEILSNKGQVYMLGQDLVGFYKHQSGVKKLRGTVCQTIIVTLDNGFGQPSFIVERPEHIYTENNPQSINYGKEVTCYYKNETKYTRNEDGTSNIEQLTISKESTTMTPMIEMLSDRVCNSISKFDTENKNISFFEETELTQGYCDSQSYFHKFGSDLREKFSKSVDLVGEYYAIKYVEKTKRPVGGILETTKYYMLAESEFLRPYNVTLHDWSWIPISVSDYNALIKKQKKGNKVLEKNKI